MSASCSPPLPAPRLLPSSCVGERFAAARVPASTRLSLLSRAAGIGSDKGKDFTGGGGSGGDRLGDWGCMDG